MKKRQSPAGLWVPILYFTQGLPYIMVISVSVIMYKQLGISNADIGQYTSLLYLPWVVKPLWSPFLEMLGNQRKWFLGMQTLIAAAFFVMGFFLPGNSFWFTSLACFWMISFASATNDIATDGFYILALSEKQQSFFVGIRSTFYRLAVITGNGLLVVLAGYLEKQMAPGNAWSYTMIATGGLMLLLTAANAFLSPRLQKIKAEKTTEGGWKQFFSVFADFFKKPQIAVALAFVLTYRLGESQLVKMTSPFLLDTPEAGGLQYSTTEVGFIYGTLGVILLVVGGLLGGFVISRDGLGKWMLPMILSLNLPNAGYALLAYMGWDNYALVSAVVMVEQFGYGFSFAGFLMYLIYLAKGPYSTSHYALATGIMALGMMLPGMISGYLQEWLGYSLFFLWVLLSGLPALLLLPRLDFPSDFGKKSKEETVSE
jgi:PAT family beta-lactamase induction signal transducer AmpG